MGCGTVMGAAAQHMHHLPPNLIRYVTKFRFWVLWNDCNWILDLFWTWHSMQEILGRVPARMRSAKDDPILSLVEKIRSGHVEFDNRIHDRMQLSSYCAYD